MAVLIKERLSSKGNRDWRKERIVVYCSSFSLIYASVSIININGKMYLIIEIPSRKKEISNKVTFL